MIHLKNLFSLILKQKRPFRYFDSREERAKFLSKIYKNYLNKSVLDVGCNHRELQKYLPEGTKYIGIDISGTPDIKIDLETQNLSMFENNSFKIVVCMEVLEHLDNIHEIFDEICRVSSKYIVISLPNNWVHFKFSLISGDGNVKFYGLPSEKPKDRHKWFFNYDQALKFIKDNVKRNGFSIKHKISIPIEYNSIKLQIFNMLFKKYYKNRFGFNNLFIESLWVLLKKNN